MFFRIYSGIFFAIVLSVVAVYTTYQLDLNRRLTQYSQSVLEGSLLLIARGYERQTAQNKQAWLSIVTRMTGLKPLFSDIKNNNQTAIPNNGQHWQMQVGDSGEIHITMFFQQKLLNVTVEQIGEQQFRAIALLILNELARNKGLAPQSVLSKIKPLYNFPIALLQRSQVLLDEQQSYRLDKGEVVVQSLESGHSYSVYVKTPFQQILHIGPVNKFKNATTELLVILIGLSLFITSLIVYGLVRRLEKRLRVVNHMVSEIGPNKMQYRVPVTGNDVITELSQKVNEMAERIEQLMNTQKEITQTVSHELKTPLARIKFRLQILVDSYQSIASKDQYSYGTNKLAKAVAPHT